MKNIYNRKKEEHDAQHNLLEEMDQAIKNLDIDILLKTLSNKFKKEFVLVFRVHHMVLEKILELKTLI